MVDVIRENKDFWWVWTKAGKKPNFFHPTQKRAENEAQRLARKYPGQKFIVLHAYAKYHVNPEYALSDIIPELELLA